MKSTQYTAKEEKSSYKSDADMSESEILQGFMEMASFSLPEEPHKYSRSKRISINEVDTKPCMKI